MALVSLGTCVPNLKNTQVCVSRHPCYLAQQIRCDDFEMARYQRRGHDNVAKKNKKPRRPGKNALQGSQSLSRNGANMCSLQGLLAKKTSCCIGQNEYRKNETQKRDEEIKPRQEK